MKRPPSFDRKQLRYIKEHTTPEQRMNWLQAAMEFALETRRAREKKFGELASQTNDRSDHSGVRN